MRNTKSNLFSVLVLMLIIPMHLLGTHQVPDCRQNPTEVMYENEPILDTVDEEMISENTEKAIRCQFCENLGQVGNPDVKFYGNIPGGMIGFAESKIFLWLNGSENAITLSFEDAQTIIPVGAGMSSHRTNYFLGDRGTYTNIPSFSNVVYKDLWPSIDLVYRATADGAKYEFRVAPGADPSDIRVRCDGLDFLRIGKTSVRIEKGDGAVVDDNLRVFQGATDIEGEFILHGSGVFGFKVSNYDKSKPLIIDPLIYSTYVSGSKYDYGWDIAVDSSGNAYVTGYTNSNDFPTVNAYNARKDGWNDVFVFKLSSDGRNLLYSTYVGGSDQDSGSGIAIDSSGNAYITGHTDSDDFPTVNAYDAMEYAGDIFVFKLSSDGSSLLYSTYVGGSRSDYGNGIAVDSSGNAYVTGATQSTDFPTVNAYDETEDNTDAVVFKLSSDGSSLLYSTYVGGSDGDYGFGIAIDSSGNAYITGDTTSDDFPTVNAYNATGGVDYHDFDVFVLKLSSDGSNLLYSTYVGGRYSESARDIAVDISGNAYVTGATESPNFPTVNAFNATLGGNLSVDVFVFKLSTDGSSLLYSTFVGGSLRDFGNGIAVDSSGNAFVTGYTHSTNFPTVNAYNARIDYVYDVFVFKLSSDGSSLLYSTYVGGSDWDHGNGIAVDSSGNAYVTGYTYSNNFPTLNAYNATGDGSTTEDVFVFKLEPPEATTTTMTSSATTTTPTTTSLEDPDFLVFAVGVGTTGLVVILVIVVFAKRKPRKISESSIV